MTTKIDTSTQIQVRPRFAGVHYALMQGLYWALMAVYLAFGAAYLYSLGLSSLQTGLTMMATCLATSLLQPLLAAWADRANRRGMVKRLALGLILPAAALLAAVWMFPMAKLLRVGLYALAWMLLWTLQFLVNSLAMEYQNAGWRLNFGTGRAFGSFGYAGAAYLFGLFTADHSTTALLPVAVGLALALLTCVALWRVPERPAASAAVMEKPAGAGREPGFFARYPRFLLLTLGATLCLTPYCAVCNYHVRLVENVGGGSVELGTLVMIAALCEAPVMLLLTRLTKRFGSARLILLSAGMFTAKMAALCLADSVQLLYAAQLFQLLSYPVFVGVSVLYADERMAPGDRVRGQSLMTLTQSAGSAAGALLGGFLLDRAGVSGMLTTCLILSAVGSVVMVLGVENAPRKEAPSAGNA